MYGQDRPRAAVKRQQKELADTLRQIPQIVPDSLDALSDPILQWLQPRTASLLPTVLLPKTSGRMLEMTCQPRPCKEQPDTPTDSLQ